MATPLPKPPSVAGFLCLIAASTFCAAAVSLAQPTRGTVVGRAVDSTDAPLPGVSVTLFPEGGGVPTSTIADHDGKYRFADVPAGTYRVDFNLQGFDSARVNHVQVQPGATATANGWLRVGSLCECLFRAAHGAPVVSLSEPPAPAPLQGQVVDDAGRPLPYATLELVTAQGRETAYTDLEGRFLVRAPAGAWSITAFDSGFEPVTREMSGRSGSLVFRLPSASPQDVASTERLKQRPCYCPGDFFVLKPR